MQFDFEKDLKNELVSQLECYHIKLSTWKSIDKLLLDYLTIRKKLLYPQPRLVSIPNQLADKIEIHPKRIEIKYLIKAFTLGLDVNLFQNKRLFQSNFHDHLLYEWNIYHFHLSLEKDKKGLFYRQTKQLLFVYITDEEAILLDTDNHGKGTFGDVKWIQILHDLYPDMISQYKYSEINEVYPKVNNIERQKLWDYGYTLVFTPIRDCVYFNPGLGRSTSGHSTQVVDHSNRILRWFFSINQQFEKFFRTICIEEGFDPQNAEFKLRLEETFEIVELNTQRIVLQFPEQFDPLHLEKVSSKH